MKRLSLPVVLALAGTINACQDIPTDAAPVQLEAPPSASVLVASDCGGQTPTPDSRAALQFASLGELGSASGLTSDGVGPYAGGSQGVNAKIFYHDRICSRSGDIVFDPDANNYRPARKLIAYFPAGNGIGLSTGGIKVGPHVNFAALMQVGSDVTWDLDNPVGRDAKIEEKYAGIIRSLEVPSTTVTRPGYPSSNVPTSKFRINLGISGCETLEYAETLSIRTGGTEEFLQLVDARAADGSPLGEWSLARNGKWTVESVDTGTSAGHSAQCYVSKKGSLVQNGQPMNMPFRAVITEMP